VSRPPRPDPVARVVRTSARVALWTSLAVAALAGWLLATYSRPIPEASYVAAERDQVLWRGIDFLALPEVRLLQSYVRIDTAHPAPDEHAGADFLAAQLAAAGVRATVERLPDRRANLWAWVEGEDPRALVLHGHLDVEPALATAGWKHPPFGGVVEGPWIYGRGMYDMKSLTIAQLLATIDAARDGRRPRRSLLFLQTSSEETGGETGTRWILAEHPELVARMDTLLTEGGVVEAIGPSDIKYWGIEFAQKQLARIRFCAADPDSLRQLKADLRRRGQGDARPDVDPSVVAFLSSYRESRGLGLYRRLLATPESVPLDRVRLRRLTKFQKALFRDEVHSGRVVRAEGGGWELEVWLHLLPGEEVTAAAARLVPEWITGALTSTAWEPMGAGLASPLDHPDFEVVAGTVREQFPGVPVGPYYLVQARTDAQRYRAAGVRSYGFSPFPIVVFDTQLIGRPNERMQLPAYRQGVALYRETVRRLLD